MAPNATHETCERLHNQLQGVSNVVATVIAEAVSSMVGWLDSGVDLMKGARHEGGLARTHLGIDAYWVRTARQRNTQYGRLAQIKKEDAPGQVVQEIRGDHGQDRQSGSHAEWSARYAMHGHDVDKSKCL